MTELSHAESAVVEVLRTGATNRQIAKALHLSEHTVKTHIRRILRKLGASTRTEIVVMLHEQERGAAQGEQAIADALASEGSDAVLARYLLTQHRAEVLAPIQALIDAAPGRPDCRFAIPGVGRRILIDVEELRRAIAETEVAA